MGLCNRWICIVIVIFYMLLSSNSLFANVYFLFSFFLPAAASGIDEDEMRKEKPKERR